MFSSITSAPSAAVPYAVSDRSGCRAGMGSSRSTQLKSDPLASSVPRIIKADKPSNPLRISVTPAASQTFVFAGTGITPKAFGSMRRAHRDQSRPEPSAGGRWQAPPRSAHRHPAGQKQAQLPELRRQEAGDGFFFSLGREPRFLQPVEDLVRIHILAPCNLGNGYGRHPRLCANHTLLVFRPIPTPAPLCHPQPR